MATVAINSNIPITTRRLERVSFPSATITEAKRGTAINPILPFRIRLTAIQIPSSIANVPAIPLQIIGFSNYIL
jgi:hypothetical protein